MKHTYLLALLLIVSSIGYTQTAAFSIVGSLCDSTEIQFIDDSGDGVLSWDWDFDDGNTSDEQNPSHIFEEPGSYTISLEILTSVGLASTQQTVTINQKPNANFTIDTTIYASYSRFFLAESNGNLTNFTWDFGDGNNTTKDTSLVYHKYSEEGTYTVKLVATDAIGCKDSIERSVQIEDLFVVPNVFTPNGDTKNDEFVVYCNGETLFSIDIYSRWGNLLFRREGHQTIVWDGRLTNGTLVKPGTYYYVISAVTEGRAYEPLHGFVTIFY